MPFLRQPIELRSTPTFAQRLLRTTLLAIAAIALFVLALAITVLATVD